MVSTAPASWCARSPGATTSALLRFRGSQLKKAPASGAHTKQIKRSRRPVVDFTDFDEARHWLERMPHDVKITLAARAALRVLPVIRHQQGQASGESFGDLALLCFRSTAVPWLSVKYPVLASTLRYAAANPYVATVGAALDAYAATLPTTTPQ
jgi:hypothetical protein